MNKGLRIAGRIAMLLALVTGCTRAQSSAPVGGNDETTGTNIPKVQARFEYFFNRVAPSSGVIPNGARMRAFNTMRSMAARARGNAPASAFEWKNAGPFNVGGRILAVAVNPKNPNTLFIGSADGGVWRSYDGGATWHSVSDAFPAMAMGSIVINPVDTAVVYAGTGEASFAQRTFDGGGLLKSTDGGTTWNPCGTGTLPAYARVSDMVINPTNPSILYAAIPDGVRSDTLTGIWKTIDAGATWTKVLDGMMNDVVINPVDPNILYTVSSPVYSGGSTKRVGMWKTIDAGATWAHVEMGLNDSLMGRTGLAISASNPNILLAGVSEISTSGPCRLIGLMKTTDAGATWNPCNVPFDYMASQGWYDNIVGINPQNPDIMYAGGVKLIRSTDGGASWTRIPDQGYGGILHVDQHALEFNPANPDIVYNGNDGGLYIITNNGATVTKSDRGLSITQFIGGAMHPTNTDLLFGGTQDNGTLFSTNRPNFDLVLYGDGGNGAIDPRKPNIMFTTQENLNLWRSEDFGQSWVRAMGGMPSEQSLFYIPYDMDLNAPSTLYLGTYRLFKTTDGGRLWNVVNNCPFQTGSSCYYVTAVSVAPYDGRLVFAGSNSGWVTVSQDGGGTWDLRRDSLPGAYCTSVRSWRAGAMYATYGTYGVPKVWRSTDLGITWTNINGDLPDIPANDILEVGNSLVLGTDLGVFVSNDQGATWQPFGTGMPVVSVQKLLFHKATGVVRAVTHGRGMYDMQFMQVPDQAPAFTSLPDTTLLDEGRPFLYMPVVTGTPRPQLTLVAGPTGAVFDPKFGTVQWTGGDKEATFTIEAQNASGTARQVFTLRTADVVQTDWTVVARDAAPTAPQQMFYAGNNVLWLTADTAIVARSIDEGQTWQSSRLPGTRASALGIHAFDANTAIVGTRDGQIFKTTDGGQAWRSVFAAQNYRFGNVHFWDAQNGMAVTFGSLDSADVYFTTDAGETWTLSPSRRYYARDPIDNTLTFRDRNLGWYATSNQLKSPPMDANILRTTDGGRTWLTYAGALRRVSAIAFATNSVGYAVDDVSGLIRKTTNGGQSWRSVLYPMSGLRNAAAYADPVSQAVWIVSDSAAWYSKNAGATWTRTALVVAGPLQTAVFADSAHGWAVMKNGIVQKLRPSSVVSVEAVPPDRAAFASIASSWPNPLSGSNAVATVAIRLPHSAHVTLTVHNSAGRVVATLIDAPLPAGEHYTTWDADGVPSGMYFYTLNAGGQVSTRRVGVIK